MHIQGVHGEVIRVQVKGLEELLHSDLSPFKVVHDAVSIHAVRLLDEAQQVLLVHAGSSVDVGVHLEWKRDDGEWIQSCNNSTWSQEGTKDIKRWQF